MKKMADDFEQRITAFHGGKPLSQKAALKGVVELEKSLTKSFRERVTHKTEVAAYLKNIQTPIHDLVAKDKRVAKGVRDFHKMNARLGKRRIAPPPSRHPKIAPRIIPGSILSVVSPPYDYEWTWSNTRGKGFSATGASKADGTAVVFVGGDGDGFAEGNAGIAKHFRPISENAFVRFTPYVGYNYRWRNMSIFLTAHSRGFVGLFIQSFNLRGGDPRTEVDIRHPLWTDGTGWVESHYDEQRDIVWPHAATVYFPATRNRHYIVWVWCHASCDDDTNFFGTSYAVAELGIRAEFMFFEQYT